MYINSSTIPLVSIYTHTHNDHWKIVQMSLRWFTMSIYRETIFIHIIISIIIIIIIIYQMSDEQYPEDTSYLLSTTRQFLT